MPTELFEVWGKSINKTCVISTGVESGVESPEITHPGETNTLILCFVFQ